MSKSKESSSSKSKKTQDNINTSDDAIIFEKEISKLSQSQQQELLAVKDFLKEFNDELFEKSQGKSMGLYVVPTLEENNAQVTINLEKLTIYFLLDDFEKPITEFNPQIILSDKFEHYLNVTTKKETQGEEYHEYSFKKFPQWRFVGSSISILRENCFDSIYDDLKHLGLSFIFSDYRGFISALKSIDIHKNMLLQKFEKYVVVYAGAGSWLRGEKSNDFDIFVVVDDTDVKRMSRIQVKDQLTRIIWQMAQDVSQLTGVSLHAQVYLLTDFWDALKDAHPVMFTFLRDGVPFYDRGLYSAWKELLKLGKIRPSPESIDLHMNGATQLMDRAKKTMQEIAMQDIYYAVLNPAQAMLMLKGYNPTTPKETVKIYEDVLFKKEQFVSEREATILKDTVKMFKDIEHDKSYVVSGKELDKRLKDADFFLKKSKDRFEEVTNQKTVESVESTYDELIKQIRELEYINSNSKTPLKDFVKEYVKTNKVNQFVEKSIGEIEKLMNQIHSNSNQASSQKTITSLESNKIIKEIRNILSEIKSIKEEHYISSISQQKVTIYYTPKDSSEQLRAEVFKVGKHIYVHNFTTSSVYELNLTKHTGKEVEMPKELEFERVNISTDLISTLKNVLQTENIEM
ncbi:MAG: hypothetical protein ACLFPL_00775 [Candidatus Nanoarchaeia archaeon]